MDDASPKALIVGGPGPSPDQDEVAAQVRALGWTVELVRLPAASALPAGPFKLHLWVSLPAPAIDAARAAHERTPEVPVVVVGGDPAPGHMWFRSPPSAAVWAAVLRELAPRPAAAGNASASARWRRKGDMIIGHSVATQELLRVLDRLAPSTAPVLVTGESGTGKELVARALHYSGPRVAGPFIALNCAAIPESLIEAELFGHQRGAFTGAVMQRAGAFEAAHNGTLFLDEIGEMPLVQQARLLRVLETSEIVRLGSTTPKAVNVRVVTATNRDLSAEVQAGRFREDLFYRLKVYPVHLQPLRNRPEDIPPIVHHHLALIAERDKRPVLRLQPAALERILGHSWPGNVRELIHVLERACLVAQGAVIEPGDVSLPVDDAQAAAGPQTLPSYRDAKQQFETEYYGQVLRIAGGNISLVAKLAQKTRKEVYDALKRLGLDAMAYRPGRGGAEAPATRGSDRSPPNP